MDELRKINNILIKDTEINTLKKYNIEVNKCSSIDEVLFLIDQIIDDLEDEEYEELDYVSRELMERKYYGEVNK